MSRNCVSVWLLIYSCVILVIFSTSCISTKSATYFNNLPDSAKIQLEELQPPPFAVQVNDVLEIAIGGENEKTVQYISQYFTGGTSGMQAIVDIDGNIELPKIGKIKVAGLSKEAVRDIIAQAYKEYLVDPLVSVKFGNFPFSVMGEVKSPGNFNVQSERVNIFQAIGQAGDLTQYAIRDDIKIIREVNGQRKVMSLNMNDKSILNSPDYYINRYDIIYVEAKGVKLTTENVQRTLTYVGAVSSVLAFVVVLLRL
ncbi:MAG TPA: polysaccharide biosynthesis/export family protein [Chitinophagaceae bacterium]